MTRSAYRKHHWEESFDDDDDRSVQKAPSDLVVAIDRRMEEHMAEAAPGQPGAVEVRMTSQNDEVEKEVNNNSGQECAGTFQLSDTGRDFCRHLLD